MTAADPVRCFVMDAGHMIISAAAMPNSPLEYRALRRSWLAAIAAMGMTEDEARADACELWKRGLDQEDDA